MCIFFSSFPWRFICEARGYVDISVKVRFVACGMRGGKRHGNGDINSAWRPVAKTPGRPSHMASDFWFWRGLDDDVLVLPNVCVYVHLMSRCIFVYSFNLGSLGPKTMKNEGVTPPKYRL